MRSGNIIIMEFDIKLNRGLSIVQYFLCVTCIVVVQ